MPSFEYKGRNLKGELIQGRLDANDSAAVADQLFNTGITPVAIAPTGQSIEVSASNLLSRFTQKVTPVDLMLFSRQMHTLLKAGVPMLRALTGLQESATNPTLAGIVQDLRISLDSGRELSAAMRRHPDVFAAFYVSLVRVGEATGRLDEIFLQLYEHLAFEKDMRDRVKAALRYPMFVVGAIGVALVIVNLFVIPVFAEVYKGFSAELPLMTRILVGFSNFTVKYWPLLLAGLVGAIVAFRVMTASGPGLYAWDRFKLRVPIAGQLILKATLARFARSFALASKSGVPIVQGLSVVSNVVENSYVAQRIEQMRDGVERGESVLRTAMTAGVFTPVVLQMIAIGDETGELDALMMEIADMYEREVDYELKTLASQIEPILIVFLAGLVLVLALGVFMPMWNLGAAAMHR